MNIRHVGVVGAGTMGNGIAQVCAMAGLDVTIVDVSTAALDRGRSTIVSSLERAGLIARSRERQCEGPRVRERRGAPRQSRAG